MNVKEIKLSQIKVYKNNAKKHDERQIEMIAESIRQFGFRQPLVLDKNNEIVVGHGRYFAAKKVGLLTVPCEYADDLTDDQIKAYRLADNRLNESPWDFAKINEELKSINFDMADFGFDVNLENLHTETEVAREATHCPTTATSTALNDDPQPREQKLSSGGEINVEDFANEVFECECPRCGFRFNRS